MCAVTEGVVLVAKLIVYKNQNELLTLELDPAREYIAGRSADCDIVLDDVVFSRQHFKLFCSNGAWAVQSISKYSQLQINHREADYFTLKSEDKFGTFSYEFLFTEEPIITHPVGDEQIEKLSDPAISADSNPEEFIPHAGSDDIQEDTHDLSQEEKTFVPEMTSEEWSIGVPYLLLRKEDGSTLTMRLEGDYWILGRDEDCDIYIDDPKASREHCEILYKQHQYYITDKNSSNGTLVNYKQIEPDTNIQIKSGDQIQIGKHLFTFEIRDPLFNEKIVSLPVETSAHAMPAEATANFPSAQRVIKLSKAQDKKKIAMIGGTVVFLLIVYLFSGSSSEQNQELSSSQQGPANPVATLTPEQVDLVEKSYHLAKTLYTQGKYGLVLTELEKIKALAPDYKDSRELEQYSKNALDTLMARKEIERSEQKERQMFAQVAAVVDQCEKSYNGNQNSMALQDCLAPALELDPENIKAAQLLEHAAQVDLRKDQIAEQQARHRSLVAQRKQIFLSAERLKRQGRALDAISAYSRHIASTLPDPENLERRSRREMHELQRRVNTEINSLKKSAESLYSEKNYRDAIAKLEDAMKLNPSDGDVKETHKQYSRELQGIVKNLYSDSVLEENLGDIESAKSKWKKIQDLDVPHGEYHRKSKVKLKKYGL